jgi:F5/8 type C domain
MGQPCRTHADCASLSCVDGTCKAPTCDDGAKNAGEADIDCGGPCSPCPPGRDCLENLDCAQGVCADAFCQRPTCTDLVQNGTETGIDCGSNCDGCDNGMGCAIDADCKAEHCADHVCVAQACTDGLLNEDETDQDCGGTECGPCQAGQHCSAPKDCVSLICEDETCTAYSCADSVLNGEETAIDCGGSNCDGCKELQHCGDGKDCASGVCLSGYCVPAAPTGEQLSRDGWSAQAFMSYPDDNPNEILDSVGGRWTSGTPQARDQWLQVDMGKLQTFFKVVLTCDEAPADAPVKYDVYLSTDGKFGAPAASGLYGGPISTAPFDTARLARYIKIVLTQEKSKWWSINEFKVLK